MPDEQENVKEAVPVAAAPQPTRFIGAEIHIISDPVTGAVSVNAPGNMIVALGLLEVAKDVLRDNHERGVREMEKKRILPASALDLKGLPRPA